MPNSPFRPLLNINAVVIALDPAGNFLFAAQSSNGADPTGSVAVLALDQATGTMSQITSSPFAIDVTSGLPTAIVATVR